MSQEDCTAALAGKTGILIGGGGFVGGALMHFFKSFAGGAVNVFSPNSKKLSLLEADDIRRYFERVRPDFIINCAIAALGSDAQLSCGINYLGAVALARAALELHIPYIHVSSAAVMPSGTDLREEDRLALGAALPHYAKSKLMAELALEQLAPGGLDYSIVRLGIVYGTHDHKIQGFQRLLFAVVNRGMPFLFTNRRVRHSYSNVRKLPCLVARMLAHRPEFSGQIYNFVDAEPVALGQVILALRDSLGLRVPRAIYLPYPLARLGMGAVARVVGLVRRLGVEARLPPEVMFFRNLYQSQALSPAKLRDSSFRDPEPTATVFSEIPYLLRYYIRRWEEQGLIRAGARELDDSALRAQRFVQDPAALLQEVAEQSRHPFLRQCSLEHHEEPPAKG
ncbi:MAG: hypothetical protein BWK76_06390 [Desulfobulbaceae bacterium A2]|nr:MAG: hypothetical protein BWK76_06390 [Desulfobulbaceae bacterium A2]